MGLFIENAEACHQAADVLKAVGHPIRLGIVALLVEEGELHVNALAERFGVSQPMISQQLRVLRMHDLVRATRQDGRATYRIHEPHLPDLVRCLENCLGKKGG